MITPKMYEEINFLKVIVNEEFKVDLMVKSRQGEFVQARMVFSKILFDKGYSYSEIGRQCNKDHALIMHYIDNFQWDYEHDDKFREQYTKCCDLFVLIIDPLYQYTNLELLMEVYSLHQRYKVLLDNKRIDLKKLDVLMRADERLEKIFDIVRENTPHGEEKIVAEKITELLLKEYY